MKVPVQIVAGVLLLVSVCGQAQSFKLGRSSQAVYQQQQQHHHHQLQPQDQEQQLRQEQLEQQRHFEALQREQQHAEYQIQQQQLEAQRLLGQPLPAQRVEGGIKGATAAPAAIAYPSKSPSLATEQRQQYLPPQSTIAYLVVRPPFEMPLSYDGAYSAEPQLQAPLIRPLEHNYATKGLRQSEELPTQQIEQQRQPQPQPALVVPVNGDKHGKLRALLDKIMSRITLGSSYSVASEELVYPQQQQQQVQTQAPAATKGEAPIMQQQIEQAPIVQQQQQQEQVPEEEPIVQQQQQQQPQQVQEQERDQGFGEELPAAQHVLKGARLEAPAKTSEPVRQVKEEPQIQQQVQEQEIIRQPPAPVKGQQQQQPLRQPEPIQQQRQEEPPTKSRRVIQLQPRQQQQQLSQQPEQVRFEPSKSY